MTPQELVAKLRKAWETEPSSRTRRLLSQACDTITDLVSQVEGLNSDLERYRMGKQ